MATRNFWGICGDILKTLHQSDQAKTQLLLAEAESCLLAYSGTEDENTKRMKGVLDNYKSIVALKSRKSVASKCVSETKYHRHASMIKLSLVTSVFNRLWQLKETLPSNLETIRNSPGSEIVLVDFGGDDSNEIAAWVDHEFSYDIFCGRLKYFRAVKPWSKFHMATAKNVAHRLASGAFVFSVDADNYVTPHDLELLFKHFENYPDAVFHQTVGPAPLRHRQWLNYGLFTADDCYHDEEVIWDGSCGRVAVSRKIYESVNGYNENFVGMGMDDIDFIIRLIRSGNDYIHYQIERPTETVFIDNGSANSSHQHSDNASNWRRMDADLKSNILAPCYVTNAPLDHYILYIPNAALATKGARVTLFSSVFRATGYVNRFIRDLNDIMTGTADVVVWLMDVVGSHPFEVSEALRELGRNDRIFYIPVIKDPGLYALWNVALRNIHSTYVGNLNVDDLRGRNWLQSCLSMLDSGLADIASPVTIPFENPDVYTYDEALSELQLSGKQLIRWFDSRVIIDGDALSPIPKHFSLIDGEYDHCDLFQVLPDGNLTSYCIPNASPVWKRVLHDHVGYFDEDQYGCFADLALWLAASSSGMRFRQVDYPALFYISSEQAHRRQDREDGQLWSLAFRYGSQAIKAWASRRSFDLSRIGGTYGDHHFLGWNWVRDKVAEHFISTPNNLILDMFVERNYFWNPNANERDFYYKKNWIGVVHTTPHQSGVYDKKSQNLDSLLVDEGFRKSLRSCKGLIVLSELNRRYVKSYLEELGKEIPVFKLFHPNIPVDLGMTDALDECEQNRLGSMVFHVGWHLRSYSAFARLNIDKQRKVLLVPKNIPRDYFFSEVVNKDLAAAGMKTIDHYVEHIYTASQDEYQNILRWGVVFNNYIAPSGSNLISECISAQALLIINRHPSFEEYLGVSYPLFFDENVSPDALIHKVYDPLFRKEVRNYLVQRSARFTVDRFCRELERIGRQLYAQ